MISARRPLNIRNARIDDAPAIAALAGELGYPCTAAEAAARLTRLLADPQHGAFVAEVTPGGVAAWLHIRNSLTLISGPHAEIAGLIVTLPQRSSGLGRALVAEAERWATARGHTVLRVRSNLVRVRTQRFYGILGFTRVKEQRVFEKRLPTPAATKP